MTVSVKPFWTIIGLLLVVALPISAGSLGLGYIMRDTPLSYFNDADLQLFQDTLTQTLSEAQDNETRTWSNPETKSGGNITALRTHTMTDSVCRQVSVVNTAKGQTGKGVYTFCRQQEGEWKIRMPGKK